MSKKTALLVATFVSLIYGMTFTVAKDVMPKHITAYCFILLRIGGAMILFWITWLLLRFTKKLPKDKIDQSDFPRIIAAAFFGVALNMLSFFKGLSLTSPINAAVIMVSTPMIVMVLSAIIIKERMSKKAIIGIVLGLIGTTLLILNSPNNHHANSGLGNFLVLVNAISYGYYLIIVKKLMDKYNALVFAKWIYLLGFLIVLPFGWNDFQTVNWATIPSDILLEIGFVVVLSTFLTYLLNLLSMKKLSPTTVAVFIYLQPLFATVFAVGLGKDKLDSAKIISAILVFSGVYLVTHKKS